MLRLLSLLVLAIAICVAMDASRLGARRGALGGGLLDMGPAAWFFACLFGWIVSLPCYLGIRPRLVRRAHALATHPQFAASAYPPAWPQQTPTENYAFAQHAPPVAATPVGPPPGYYRDPEGPYMRWWDGANWAPRDS